MTLLEGSPTRVIPMDWLIYARMAIFGQDKGQRRRYRQRTPAVAAGVTDHRWTVREVWSYPIAMS